MEQARMAADRRPESGQRKMVVRSHSPPRRLQHATDDHSGPVFGRLDARAVP